MSHWDTTEDLFIRAERVRQVLARIESSESDLEDNEYLEYSTQPVPLEPNTIGSAV